MKISMPTLIGERYQVVAYVDPSVFQKIESMCDDVSRSRFVGKLIKKIIEQ
jgi:hypothetical protein